MTKSAIRFKPEQFDSILKRIACEHEVNGETVAGNPNMLVPWYLMASYMYYEKDDPFLTDECFDWLCKELDEKWDEVDHWHKDLVDRDALKAGTGYQIDWSKMPTRIKDAATHLVYKYTSPDEVGKITPPPSDIDDLLGTPTSIEDLL